MHTKTRTRVRSFLALTLIAAIAVPSVAQNKQKKKKRKRRPSPVFAKIKDNPKLPRALLIGDSISIGYTLPTRALLKGKANLHRIPTNGGPTTRGLQNIDKWLGDSKWDVIHFNWGLHDLKYIGDKRQVSPEAYEKNLTRLVARLKKTGATLIWCNTTPVPKGVKPHRTNDDVLKYNAIAKKIMDNNKIAINDLYTYADKRLSKIQRPKNVHFTPAGSKVLAKKVAAEIIEALAKK